MSKIKPVSPTQQKDLCWLPVDSFNFASYMSSVPVALDELSSMAVNYALGFIKSQKGFRLVALLGSGGNLYVHPETGRWLNPYVPAELRSKPFSLGHFPDNPDKPILCIDEDYLVSADTPQAQPLFNDSEQLTGKSAEVLQFLLQRLKGYLAADRVSMALASAHLLEPWDFSITMTSKVHRISGVYRVNEQAVKQLEPEKLAHLSKNQGLAMAYAQLLSTHNFRKLSELAIFHDKLNENTNVPDIDALFGEKDDSLFKFN